jgi:hypothetical protein
LLVPGLVALQDSTDSSMDYRRINDSEIEIIPGRTPIEIVLESLARISYESAEPPRSEFLELLDHESETIDFSTFIHLDESEILDMDFVNERKCKTKVRKTSGGKYVFDARLYQNSRGRPETLLDKVKSELEKDFEDSQVSARSDSQKHRRGWLEALLEFLLDLFT